MAYPSKSCLKVLVEFYIFLTYSFMEEVINMLLYKPIFCCFDRIHRAEYEEEGFT